MFLKRRKNAVGLVIISVTLLAFIYMHILQDALIYRIATSKLSVIQGGGCDGPERKTNILYTDEPGDMNKDRGPDLIGVLKVKDYGSIYNANEPLRNNKEITAKEGSIKKVILIAYSRGGSSFLGQLFALNPESFYWFEIVQPMYLAMAAMLNIPSEELYDGNGLRREQTWMELDYIYQHLGRFFNCELDHLPVEMLAQDSIRFSGSNWNTYINCLHKTTRHKVQHVANACLRNLTLLCRGNAEKVYKNGCFHAKLKLDGRSLYSYNDIHIKDEVKVSMENYHNCLMQSDLTSAVRTCLPKSIGTCQRTKIRATKILRMRLSDTESIINQHPDVKVIHQLRDPRGSLVSCKTANIIAGVSKHKITEEAKLLCDKMLQDIRAYQILKMKYPQNYLGTRYEELADKPMETLEKIYAFIDADIPNILRSKLHNITNNVNEPMSTLNTFRRNSSLTAHKWRTKIDKSDKISIDETCAEVLEEADYNV